jgi:hypothetical protein
MRFMRRRSDRPDPTRWGRASSLEVLEGRALLSTFDPSAHPFSFYLPTDLRVQNPITHQPETLVYQHLLHDQNPQSPLLNNQGKVVSGTDRQGNQWTITVHGPGSVIVTDATPNDGALDDNINTIQLIGTSLKDTYVTGTVTGSPYLPTETTSTVLFNKLIDFSGVKSVILNGFTLTQTVSPGNAPNNAQTGIFLYGGVGTLSFNQVLANITTNNGTLPINIIVGDPNTPLKVKPAIEFGNVYNNVYNPTATTAPPAVPQTTPTVNIVVNGVLNDIAFVSAGQNPPLPSGAWNLPGDLADRRNDLQNPPPTTGQLFLFPIVATTGRTAVQAKAIDHLHVRGSATNFTASRGQAPFQNSLAGLDHLGTASFRGTADAVGLDVNGPIGKLRFSRGLGNPTGTSPATTQLGIPAANLGYPANGLVGGLVTATKIGKVRLGPANVVVQTAQNPNLVQTNTTGSATYYPQPGNAASSAAIVSSGKIGKVAVLGNLQSSEIKTGFDYPSFAAGLQGTRARSLIKNSAFRGDLVSSAVSATYRAANQSNGSPGSITGPGSIKGNLANKNALYTIGSTTPLLDTGQAGFFAKHKHGYLPPPSKPTRVDSVQVR